MSEWIQLPLGEYDLAHLAYEIERVDMKMAGGKIDKFYYCPHETTENCVVLRIATPPNFTATLCGARERSS